MVKLRTLKNTGSLRQYTDLHPKPRNKTRWTGTVSMLERFLKMKTKLQSMSDEITKIYQLALKFEISNTIYKILKKFTIELQKANLTLNQSKQQLDHVIDSYEASDFSIFQFF